MSAPIELASASVELLDGYLAGNVAHHEHLVPGGFGDAPDRFVILLPYLEAHDPALAEAVATIYHSLGQLRRMSADRDSVSS